MHTAYASWREIYYNIPGNEQWPHKCKLNYTCTTSIPFITLAKTVCLLSSQGVATVVIKNWDPLVFGPAFAIDTVKGLSCRKLQKNTNAKWLLISIHPSIFLSTLVLIYSSSLSLCLCLSACLSIYHPLCACVCVCVCVCVCITTTPMGIKHPITFVHADSQSICPPRDNHHCLPQINFACPWNSHKWNQQNILFHVSGFFHSA